MARFDVRNMVTVPQFPEDGTYSADEAVVNCEQRQFKAVEYPELIEEVCDVVLDGVFAD